MDAVSEFAGLTPNDMMLALIRAKQDELAQQAPSEQDKTGESDDAAPVNPAREGQNGSLSKEERRVVDQLRARDREVRDHEQAHTRVGGAYASQPTYSYQTGPDGKRYAIGGQVQIDVSPVPDDPAATIAKMMIVKAAALAPAEPSSADRKVASMADSVSAQAQADLSSLKAAERRGENVDVRV